MDYNNLEDERLADRRRIIKKRAAEYLGGKCSICGYSKSVRALEFHHINPLEKSFGISAKGLARKWDILKPELDKCILVCSNCHAEIHEKEYLEQQANKKENKIPETIKIIKEKKIYNCNYCGKEINNRKIKYGNIYCSRGCSYKGSQKIEWPSKEDLEKLVWEKPLIQLSEDLKISDRSIKRKCQKLNIKLPPMGYWAKK